jgi:hypothetical protein
VASRSPTMMVRFGSNLILGSEVSVGGTEGRGGNVRIVHYVEERLVRLSHYDRY